MNLPNSRMRRHLRRHWGEREKKKDLTQTQTLKK